MTSRGKQFYDREDLDDEEQKLFDEMVLEEMEKLENQFKEATVSDGRRDQRLLTLNLDTICDDGREDSEDKTFSSAHGRSNDYNTSQRAEPRHEKSNAPIASATICPDDQPARRAPRNSLVADNFPRPKQETSLNTSESFIKDNQEQQFRRESSNVDSRSPVQDPHQPTRRFRRGDSSPDSRVVSNISLIGASDSSIVSPSQKREQQAKYAMQLAEGAANSRSARSQVDNFSSRPSRRVSVDITMEDASNISQIGQDSQQLKERRKTQQFEYAQQLSNQQSQRHFQNNSPVLDKSPRSQDNGMQSARGHSGSSSYSKDGSPTANRSGMVNFGTDPTVEAAKKRETKAAYGRQLLEQQNSEQGMKSRAGSRSDSFRENSIASPRYTGYDSREDERNAAKSAAEVKREQQRKYRDEISSAASAAPISSARVSLQGGSGSGSDLVSSPGSAPPRKMGNVDAYTQSNGPGLTSGNTLSFLSSADAERLEARSKKVQLQQMYAKQLTEDSAVVSLSGTNISRMGSSSGGRASSLPASRRASTESDDVSSNSRGAIRPASGNSLMSAVTATVNSDGRGMFDPISEKDQLAMVAAKKKASQVEYYQQLQEADSRRSDPSVQASQRVTLYRSRDQQEQEGVSTGRHRDDNSARQSSISMPSASYPLRGQGESSGCQGQAYSVDAGPGLSFRKSASDPRCMADGDSWDVYARKRQQEEYARALRSDAETGAIPDTYTAQRRSHHDREGPGNASRGSRPHAEEKFQERDIDRYQEREQGRYPPRDFDARHSRESETELDGYSVSQHDRNRERERERNGSRDQAPPSQRGREREAEQSRQPLEQEMHRNNRVASGGQDRRDPDPDPHIDIYSYSRNNPNGSTMYDPSSGPYNGGQGTFGQYARTGSSSTTSRANELIGETGAGQRDGDREKGRQEDRGQGAGYSNGYRGDTDSGYNEEFGRRSRHSSHQNDPPNQSYHPPGSERSERQYEQHSPRPMSGSNPGPSSSTRQGQPQSREQGQYEYQAAPQSRSYSQPGGNLSQRDIAPVPVSAPVGGRGRSSGGGASSISLCG